MIQKVRDYISPEKVKPWTIRDAKKGDVLATDSGDICLFDGTVEDGKYPFAYCGLTRHGFEFYDKTLPFTHDYVYPATQKQCDLFFQKMKEAGYKWDINKKELIKLEIMKKDLLIQERKAKAYDEAVKKAEEIIKYYKTHNRSDEASIEDLETIFPELKESENERIKREILELVSISGNGNQFEEIKDWLEKKTLIIPKFRVGDEIKTANEESLTITKIDERGYWSEDLFICSFDEECIWDLVKEQSVEPDWCCHHKVDFSGCSEEYRKAYYDGWNSCNIQHSQHKAEFDDVIKCLVNGFKYFYSDEKENEDTDWGDDKSTMSIAHIIEVLEKHMKSVKTE